MRMKHCMQIGRARRLDANFARDGASPRRARGFSMVEALVAVVIVALGLLGIGQLTLQGLRESSAALVRTRGVYLISDMIERIRANPGTASDINTPARASVTSSSVAVKPS